jgi:DNA-binding NtrC family response regulator
MIRAIVVEDEFLLRDYAKSIIEDEGYDVTEFVRADDALTYLNEVEGNDVALVFTDVQVPGRLNGTALAHEIAARWPGIFVIVTSGDSRLQPSDLPDNVRFFEKPWRPEELVEQLRVTARGH